MYLKRFGFCISLLLHCPLSVAADEFDVAVCKAYPEPAVQKKCLAGLGEIKPTGAIQSCGSASLNTGTTYKVTGSGHNMREGPGDQYAKIINERASKNLKGTVYAVIDKSTTVVEECSHEGWSKIRITVPDWLSNPRGWVESKHLRGKKVDSSGIEVFTEADLCLDEEELPYKDIMVAGLNKLRRENTYCKEDMQPCSAVMTSDEGSKSDPVFAVSCGKMPNYLRATFSKSDVENERQLRAKQPISKAKAIDLCERYAKSKAAHPSTVDFSRVMSLSVKEYPNGRTRVTSKFTAKNMFNLELKYKISCLLDSNGLIEANIYEAN